VTCTARRQPSIPSRACSLQWQAHLIPPRRPEIRRRARHVLAAPVAHATQPPRPRSERRTVRTPDVLAQRPAAPRALTDMSCSPPVATEALATQRAEPPVLPRTALIHPRPMSRNLIRPFCEHRRSILLTRHLPCRRLYRGGQTRASLHFDVRCRVSHRHQFTSMPELSASGSEFPATPLQTCDGRWTSNIHTAASSPPVILPTPPLDRARQSRFNAALSAATRSSAPPE
jgi:hypothetical protein